MSVIVNEYPGLLGVIRDNAAFRNVALVASVCLRPKKELFEPLRSGRNSPVELVGVNTFN